MVEEGSFGVAFASWPIATPCCGEPLRYESAGDVVARHTMGKAVRLVSPCLSVILLGVSLTWFTIGDVVYVHIFGQGLVYLNTYEAALDLLDRRGSIYSDKPRLVMVQELYVHVS